MIHQRQLAEPTNASATKSDVDVPVAVLFFGVHAAASAALFVEPTLPAIALMLGWFTLSGFGITVGFHRLLSHRSFDCSIHLRRIFATLGTLALQGGPAFWVGLHRRHHRCADRDGDPHTPQRRFLDGHMLWVLRKSTKSAAILAALSHRDLRQLGRDPYLRRLDQGVGPLVPWAASLVLCGLLAGVEGVVWGGFVRTVIGWHSTWLVNSVGHRWGARPHATADESRNVVWLTPIAFGDQWHNNHHADPRRAVLTERWWQIDPSGWLILLMARLGLATNVRGPRRIRAHDTDEKERDDDGND